MDSTMTTEFIPTWADWLIASVPLMVILFSVMFGLYPYVEEEAEKDRKAGKRWDSLDNRDSF